MVALLAFVVSVLVIGWMAARKTKYPTLHPEEWRKFKLIRKVQRSHNTSSYFFELAPGCSLNLPVGQHISVRALIDGKFAVRSYTPVSTNGDLGYFELLVKTYPNGVISQYLHKLETGDLVEIKGPKGNFRYESNMVSHLGMIAGGTGLTPMLQGILFYHRLFSPY